MGVQRWGMRIGWPGSNIGRLGQNRPEKNTMLFRGSR